MRTVTCNRCGDTTPLHHKIDIRHGNYISAKNGWILNLLHEVLSDDKSNLVDLCDGCVEASKDWINKGVSKS